MKAVNLIPSDNRRAGGGSGRPSLSSAHAVIGLLALAVGFVAIYVLTTNTISTRKAKVAALQSQVAEATAEAAQLTSYTQFAQLAQARSDTVTQIAAARFDWRAALSDLSKVVPANTALQSLLGTVVPGTSAGGGSGGGADTGPLRGAISAPAFEMRGCTKSQDDVARLLSRLRAMNGVTRVTLADSQKGPGGAATATASPTTTGSAPTGCSGNAATFDLVVFFQPVPNAGPNGVSAVASAAGAATTPGTSGAGAATTPGTTPATTPATTPGTTPATTPAATPGATPAATTSSTPAAATPVSTTTPAGGTQ